MDSIYENGNKSLVAIVEVHLVKVTKIRLPNRGGSRVNRS